MQTEAVTANSFQDEQMEMHAFLLIFHVNQFGGQLFY